MRAASLALALFAAGCTVSELELEGRECPCIDGWVCDDARNVCVRGEDAMDAGGARDAGGERDAEGPRDAGSERDAGAVDAGPADAGTEDAFVPVDAGDPTSCDDIHAGALFCDGFEDIALAAWDGAELNGPDALVERATDVVYRGAGALRASALERDYVATMYANVFPDGATDQWLRAYVYFPSDTTVNIEYMAMRERDNAYSWVTSAWPTESDFHTHDFASGVGATFDSVMPRDTWVCVEMHIVISVDAGVFDVYWDDTLMVSRTGQDTSVASGLPRIDVGIDFRYYDEPANEVYVDEVVAHTSRIGCD